MRVVEDWAKRRDEFLELDAKYRRVSGMGHHVAGLRGALCAQCVFNGCERGPVFSIIRSKAKLLVLAEAPGTTEVEGFEPLIGRSGEVLWDALAREGIVREECSMINAIECQPPPKVALDDMTRRVAAANAKLAPGEAPVVPPVPACSPRFAHDVRIALLGLQEPGVILALGEKALSGIAAWLGVPYAPSEIERGKLFFASLSKQQGAPVFIPADHVLPDGSVLGRQLIVLASYHPAFAMRTKEYMSVVRAFIGRAAILVRNGGKLSWVPPPAVDLLALGPERTIEFLVELVPRLKARLDSVWVTSDLETDGIEQEFLNIRCFGFHIMDDLEGPTALPEFTFVVPWIDYDRRHFFNPEQEKVAREVLRWIYKHCRLVFHNGGPFDTRCLINNDFMDADLRPFLDTRLMHRNSFDTDLPHDLDFVSSRFLDLKKWKHEADAKDAKGVRHYADLLWYCNTDVAVTGRLRRPLSIEILRAGTGPQMAEDAILDPIFREMGRMGIVVDEIARGEASKKYHELVWKLRKGFQAVVRKLFPDIKDINPGSSKQLGELFFDRLGYEPTLNSQGYAWVEGEPRSTRYDAIVLIEQEQVLPRAQAGDERAKLTRQAIDYLLRYKAAYKLLTGFIDSVRARDWPGLASGTAPTVEFEFEFTDDDDEFAQLVRIESLPARPNLRMLFSTFMMAPPSGRLSSKPNIQNIPSSGFGKFNAKTMFRAPPGHKFVGADYAQIEQRLYTVDADDRMIWYAYKNGLDSHSWNTAALVTSDTSMDGITREYHRIENLEKKARKTIRQTGKTTAYAETYGVEEEKIGGFFLTARDKSTGELMFPDMTEEKAIYYHNRWHEIHPETRVWQARMAQVCRRDRFIASMFLGRRRHFPDGPTKKNAPANHRIQASAADIVNAAVKLIVERIPFRKWSEWTGLVNHVHDQLVVCVPDSRVDEAKKILAECMYAAIEGMEFPVDEVAAGNTLAEV